MSREMLIPFFLIGAFLAAWILTFFLRRYALKHEIIDKPGPRSSHKESTPRGGGLSFVIVWLLFVAAGFACGLFSLQILETIFPGAVLLAGIGFLDDHFALSPRIRFTVQLLGALALIAALNEISVLDLGFAKIPWRPFGLLFSAMGIIWSVNLFNFMDGIDALASMEAICISVVGGGLFWLAGGETEALSLWCLTAAVSGFLIWNLPPAKIFMGDTGSYFLGFLIAAYALLGSTKYQIPVLLWVILYGSFWFDATATLARRIFRREKWHQAHRSHAYQRLYQSGWSHGKVSIGVVCLNIILTALALVGYFFPLLLSFAFIAALVLLTIAYGWVERCSSIKQKHNAYPYR